MSCLILCEVTYFLVSTNARRPNVKVRRVVSIEDRGAKQTAKNLRSPVGIRLSRLHHKNPYRLQNENEISST